MLLHRLGLVLCLASAASSGQTWTPLFDGKTLNGWHVLGGASKFETRDGTSVPNAQHTFLATDKTYGDFILEYEFLVDPELNSGVQIRSHTNEAGKVYGLQVEIDGDTRTKRFWSGGIFDQTRRGWLADLSKNEPARKAFKPGEWNHTRVEAIGDSIKTWINGVPAADLVDSAELEGFIALQVHQNKSDQPMHVSFRNIRIQNLGRSKWMPMADWGNLGGDFTFRFEVRGKASDPLTFENFSLRRNGDAGIESRGLVVAVPQKDVKPILPGEWKRLTVSYHGRRLVVHVDGVRVQDLRNVYTTKKLGFFTGSEVRAAELLQTDRN